MTWRDAKKISGIEEGAHPTPRANRLPDHPVRFQLPVYFPSRHLPTDLISHRIIIGARSSGQKLLAATAVESDALQRKNHKRKIPPASGRPQKRPSRFRSGGPKAREIRWKDGFGWRQESIFPYLCIHEEISHLTPTGTSTRESILPEAIQGEIPDEAGMESGERACQWRFLLPGRKCKCQHLDESARLPFLSGRDRKAVPLPIRRRRVAGLLEEKKSSSNLLLVARRQEKFFQR